ncbi:MAG TPA: hypothetical protein VJL29_04280 [Thermoguttaceae bacterium]|nr:hypothetical protein [Thermoguttaceae bacterium]
MFLVLVFIAVMLSIFSLSYRHVATALRAETVLSLNEQRDQGAIQALGAGVAQLGIMAPPSTPCICAVLVNGSSYTLTFTLVDEPTGQWRVEAQPTGPFDAPPAMSDVFIPPTPPAEPLP